MRRSIEVGLATLAFAVAFLQFTPVLRAQSQNQAPSAQQQPNQQPAQQQNQTFMGQIIQTKSGQYALLVDKNAGKGFFLDNQQEAKKHNGENVKVTGTLNPQTGIIRVSQIAAAGR